MPYVVESNAKPQLGSDFRVAVGGPVHNNANNSSILPKSGAGDVRRKASRAARFETRAWLWEHSKLQRVRKCGKCSRLVGGHVQVRFSDGVAGFGGLVSCGSVWLCPVCSMKVAMRRGLEIGLEVASAASQGVPVALLTFTMRHNAGQTLEALWDALGGAWSKVTSGTSWKRDLEAFGLLGFHKVVEVTVSRDNGWHVHIHVLVFGQGLNGETLPVLFDSMFGRWSRSLVRSGLGVPLMIGQDAQMVGVSLDGTKLGDYLAKGVADPHAIALELTQTQSKGVRGRHSTMSTWALLDLARTEDPWALGKWAEYERASHGRQQMSRSKSLLSALGLDLQAATDEEIAGEEIGTKDDTVVVIRKAGWKKIVREPWIIPAILSVLEESDALGLCLLLERLEISHWRL